MTTNESIQVEAAHEKTFEFKQEEDDNHRPNAMPIERRCKPCHMISRQDRCIIIGAIAGAAMILSLLVALYFIASEWYKSKLFI